MELAQPMNVLPDSLLSYVFIFLPTREIFCNLVVMNKTFYQEINSNYFLTMLIQRDLYLHKSPSLRESSLKEVLSANLSPSEDQLHFVGFCTDGGVDEDHTDFWCSNIFAPNNRAYCSREQVLNVNVVGVFHDLFGFENINQKLNQTINNWATNYSEVFNSYLFEDAIGMFKYFKERIPETPDIDSMMKYLELITFHPYKSRRDPDSSFILETIVDKEFVNNSRHLACIHKLFVSRTGGFTCPAASLIVFASEVYVDVTDPSLQAYNNMTTADCFDTPPIQPIPGVEVIEFSRTHSTLKPVIWVRFLPQPRQTEVTVQLSQKVSAAYLYIKLLEPENRREEQGWNHDYMNIDFSCLLPMGKPIFI